ncbi:hypothetical protein B0H17DRAFT_1142664 [Mycena rosella]|uniref:Uncharacterized protein n=1 Tax=Mycena rosella TaxID=1033263 RepID=A0AAD7CX92_MYCRO|nr:hypothetical protein B0H17DRAFT_1142664 [Mycena rosella]
MAQAAADLLGFDFGYCAPWIESQGQISASGVRLGFLYTANCPHHQIKEFESCALPHHFHAHRRCRRHRGQLRCLSRFGVSEIGWNLVFPCEVAENVMFCGYHGQSDRNLYPKPISMFCEYTTNNGTLIQNENAWHLCQQTVNVTECKE